MDEPAAADPDPHQPSEVRTFLIADVRGYTLYTREHGDGAASHLPARLAEVVRGVVPDFHGELLELRGDEAVSVFRSAREAIRAAVELQRELRAAWTANQCSRLGSGWESTPARRYRPRAAIAAVR